MDNISQAPNIIWVTGRAASGKSTFIRIAEEECRDAMLETVFLSDEKFLFQIINEDVTHMHHYHPFDDDRFLFKTNYPFDEGIRRINERLNRILNLELDPPVVVLIEMARGRCQDVIDVSFQRAFSLIDPMVIRHSNFFYLKSRWVDQLERNRARQTDGEPHPPDSIMYDLYREDDFAEVSNLVSFEIIDNERDKSAFENQIREKIKHAVKSIIEISFELEGTII